MKYFVSFPTTDQGTVAVSMHDIHHIVVGNGRHTELHVTNWGDEGSEVFHTTLSVEGVISKIQKQAAQYERMLCRESPKAAKG